MKCENCGCSAFWLKWRNVNDFGINDSTACECGIFQRVGVCRNCGHTQAVNE